MNRRMKDWVADQDVVPGTLLPRCGGLVVGNDRRQLAVINDTLQTFEWIEDRWQSRFNVYTNCRAVSCGAGFLVGGQEVFGAVSAKKTPQA
jgi:hypothetical protein